MTIGNSVNKESDARRKIIIIRQSPAGGGSWVISRGSKKLKGAQSGRTIAVLMRNDDGVETVAVKEVDGGWLVGLLAPGLPVQMDHKCFMGS